MTEIRGQKHAGLTALGVLCVVLGVLFVIASVWGLLQPQVHQAVVAQSRAPQLLTGLSVAWAYADAALNLVLAVLLFIAGIGLLRLRRWGARLAIAYSLGRIALSLASFVLTFLGPIAHRPTGQQIESLREPVASFLKTEFMPVAVTLTVGGLVLSVLFAVILLCLLSRRSYRESLS